MSTVAYITRDLTGTKQHGEFAEGASIVDATSAKDISLNMSASDVESYQRIGNDLQIVTHDGQTLVLDNYFAEGITGEKNLFLSEDGTFVEVLLEDRAEGMLYPTYEPLDLTGKWSAYDDMAFLDLDRIEPVVAPLAAPLLGLGGLGTAAAAAGVLGAAIIGGGGGDGGGSGDPGAGGIADPTVDNPDAVVDVSGNTTDPVVVSGTGEPGSDVVVAIGDTEQTTTIGDDGTWTTTFDPADLPVDGSYDVVVTVDDPDGVTHELDGPSINIDTTPPPVEVTAGTQSVGEVVNGTEYDAGTVISGTGEAGASVAVSINGTTHETTVADDGSWSVTFASSELESGEYETAVSITSTDSFGNATTLSDVLEVDTVAPAVGFDAVEGDNMANAAEASDGIVISGTGEAGASISVELLGETMTTTVANDGSWSLDFASSVFTAGEYDATATVTTVDAAGNSTTSAHTFAIDTVAPVATVDTVETDDVVNAAEASDGVTLSGTGEAGSTVSVAFLGATRTATVGDDGTWSLDYDASALPSGETTATATVTITDLAGNVGDTVTHDVEIDTLVNTLTADGNQTADDVINSSERESGLTLSGTVEAGSTVFVTIEGVEREATVDDAGNWTVDFLPADLPEGTYSTSASIVATDAAGNSETITETFTVDTQGAPEYLGLHTDVGFIEDLEFAEALTDMTVNTIADDGTVASIDGATAVGNDPFTNETETTFRVDNPADIPDGSVLVVSSTDAAGNSASTMVVIEDAVSGSDLFANTGLTGFNIENLNLNESADSNLVLTEADILALSDNTDTLVVQGGVDDTLTVTSATLSETRDINGDTFNVYTVGTDGATLIVDENVNVII